MKILIVSANSLSASPIGPAYIAGTALAGGHQVEVFDVYFAENILTELQTKLQSFNPDVVGISIRVVTGDIVDLQAELQTKFFDFRPVVKEVVTCIKANSDAKIILGGPGFNYFAEEWLRYLDLDFGIRGEGEVPFSMYLERISNGKATTDIPGVIFKKNDRFVKNPRYLNERLDQNPFPAYHLFDLEKYRQSKISYGIYTKKGCAFHCSFCPHSSLEGKKYRLKSPSRVVDEIEYIKEQTGNLDYFFCDNSFNVPKHQGDAICRGLIDRKTNINWKTGDLKPIGITKEQIELFIQSGCTYVNLAVESASDTILKEMNRKYTVKKIKSALEVLSEFNLPFGVSWLVGMPSETPETIEETLDVLNSFPKLVDVWVSFGLCLWTHHQDLLKIAKEEGQLKSDRELFEGAYYISPSLPKDYMLKLIEDIKKKENYDFQVNIPYVGYEKIK